MKGRVIIFLALAAAVMLASVAGAGPAAKQRVSITGKGLNNASSAGRFVLDPLGAGALKHDSGRESSVIAYRRAVTREGQSGEIVTWVTTCVGKRGSFVLRVRIEQLQAGNGYHIGTGTWKLVRGTGAYAGITGGGRVANAWVESGSRSWTERRDGFLVVP
jgi:hypothetical protein